MAQSILIDGNTGQPTELGNVALLLDYAGRTDGQPVFICYAAPGTPTSAPYWKIAKHEYDGSDRLVRKLWADGKAKFEQIADARATLTYS